MQHTATEAAPERSLLPQLEGRPEVQGGKERQVRGVIEQTVVEKPGTQPEEQHEGEAHGRRKERLHHSIKQQKRDQPQSQQEQHGRIGGVPYQQWQPHHIGREGARHIAHGAGDIAIVEPGALPGAKIALLQHLELIGHHPLVFGVEKREQQPCQQAAPVERRHRFLHCHGAFPASVLEKSRHSTGKKGFGGCGYHSGNRCRRGSAQWQSRIKM